MRANGESIRQIRERSGVSQALLCEQSGVESTALNRIESGKRQATAEQIVALARALKVPVTAIICDCKEVAA